jgi:hypothetical protein
MRNAGMKHRRVVHKSTVGILNSIPEAVGLVGNPPPRLDKKHSRSPARGGDYRGGNRL